MYSLVSTLMVRFASVVLQAPFIFEYELQQGTTFLRKTCIIYTHGHGLCCELRYGLSSNYTRIHPARPNGLARPNPIANVATFGISTLLTVSRRYIFQTIGALGKSSRFNLPSGSKMFLYFRTHRNGVAGGC